MGRNGCPEGSVPVASTAHANRPGPCRVAAIELTRGPDKPGNSRVEVVDSGVETSMKGSTGGWLAGAASRPRRDVDSNVRPQDSGRVSGSGEEHESDSPTAAKSP